MNTLQKILGIGILALALNGCSGPLTKAVTTSAGDYCKSVGKELKDYNLSGVSGYISYDTIYWIGTVPEGTEVVADIRKGQYSSGSSQIGTALIPKKPSN